MLLKHHIIIYYGKSMMSKQRCRGIIWQ